MTSLLCKTIPLFARIASWTANTHRTLVTSHKYTNPNKPGILQNPAKNRLFQLVVLSCRALNDNLLPIRSNLANLGANWLVGGEKNQKEFNETVSVWRLRFPSCIRWLELGTSEDLTGLFQKFNSQRRHYLWGQTFRGGSSAGNFTIDLLTLAAIATFTRSDFLDYGLLYLFSES
jgi:hypothetical protein